MEGGQRYFRIPGRSGEGRSQTGEKFRGIPPTSPRHRSAFGKVSQAILSGRLALFLRFIYSAARQLPQVNQTGDQSNAESTPFDGNHVTERNGEQPLS